MALPNLENQNIQDTYQRVVQTDGNKVYDGTGSLLPIEFNENNVIISGTLIAQSYIVSESITAVSSGSTIFGNSSDDIHQITGSLDTLGPITASGDISASGHLYADNLYVDDILSDNISLRFGKRIKAAGIGGTLYDVAVIAGEAQMNFGDSDVNLTSMTGEKIAITAGSAIHGSINLISNQGSITFQDNTTPRISFDVDTTPGISFNGAATISSHDDSISFTGGTNITSSGNIWISGSGTYISSSELRGAINGGSF